MAFSTNTFNTFEYSSSEVDISNVTIDFTVSYSISTPVVRSVNINYSIDERVSKSLEIAYESTGYIATSLTMPYMIEERVTYSLEVLWFTQGEVEATVVKNKVCAKSAPNKVSICY